MRRDGGTDGILEASMNAQWPLCDMREADLSPQDRSALTTYFLQRGYRFLTGELAEAFGMTTEGARVMLCNMSRVIPLRRESARGPWYLVTDEDPD